MVTIDAIERGVAEYMDCEVMPNFPGSGIEKVFAGTAMSLIIKNQGKVLAGLKENQAFKMLGIMDQNGDIDIDTLSDEFKKNIPNGGVKVEIPVFGTMTFHKADVDKLCSYIKKK